jgi:hypothetical protein
MPLTKEQILGAKDLPTKTVAVPEWAGEVIVRTMMGIERDAFEQSIAGSEKKVNLENIRAKLCAKTIVNEAGQLLFTDDDIAALGAKSARALDKIYDIACKLNGIGKDDIKELEKNSGSIPKDGSTSDSHDNADAP